MTVGLEAYRCAVGRFSAVFVHLMYKKLLKSTRSMRDQSRDKVYSGTDIALFFAWVTLSALILYAVPFCVRDVFRIRPTFPALPARTLNSSPASLTTPNLSFLLLCCGDVESNPGPSMEQTVKSSESKVNGQETALGGKIDKLMELLTTTREQIEIKFRSLEDNILAETGELKRQFSQLKDSVTSVETSLRQSKKDIESIQRDQNFITGRVKALEEKLERQERYSRRSNVLIYGMKEEASETFDNPAKLLTVLRKHFPQKNWQECDIEIAHRLGSGLISPTGQDQ